MASRLRTPLPSSLALLSRPRREDPPVMTVIMPSMTDVFPAPVSPVNAVVPMNSNVRLGIVPQLIRTALFSLNRFLSRGTTELTRIFFGAKCHGFANQICNHGTDRNTCFTVVDVSLHRNAYHTPAHFEFPQNGSALLRIRRGISFQTCFHRDINVLNGGRDFPVTT